MGPIQLELANLPICGREAEMKALDHGYANSFNSCKLLTVFGKSGSGKSSLVLSQQEKWKKKSDACFTASGKFGMAQEPFQAILSALNEILDQWSLTDQGISEIKKCLENDAINEHFYRRFLPRMYEIAHVNGPTNGNGAKDDAYNNSIDTFNTDVSRDEEIDGHRRFGFHRLKVALSHFLTAVCSSSRRLVLFLDDIQWADQPNLELIGFLAKADLLRGFLLIVSYREEMVDVTHPVATLLSSLQE